MAEKIYLTVDVDWACDAVLQHTIDLLETVDVTATFFITHDTPLLERLRANPKFELGAHPNFNRLLSGEDHTTAQHIIQQMQALVPEATSVRSHALAAGSFLSSLFYQAGYRRESNYYYHASGKHIPLPHIDPSGMLRILHHWEDDCHCIWMEKGIEPNWDAGRFLAHSGYKVFIFHPIHLYLNTETLARYEASRYCHRDVEVLAQHVNHASNGTACFFHNLLWQAQANGLQFSTIREIPLA